MPGCFVWAGKEEESRQSDSTETTRVCLATQKPGVGRIPDHSASGSLGLPTSSETRPARLEIDTQLAPVGTDSYAARDGGLSARAAGAHLSGSLYSGSSGLGAAVDDVGTPYSPLLVSARPMFSVHASRVCPYGRCLITRQDREAIRPKDGQSGSARIGAAAASSQLVWLHRLFHSVHEPDQAPFFLANVSLVGVGAAPRDPRLALLPAFHRQNDGTFGHGQPSDLGSL